MWNMSFHVVMSGHVIMSRHVIMLETGPCVCTCPHSPTDVKDQYPRLCVKCPCPHSRLHPSNTSVSSKSGSKTLKTGRTKCHIPVSACKHVQDDIPNMSFHVTPCCNVTSCCHVRDLPLCVYMSTFTHRCQRPVSPPPCKVSMSTFPPPPK